MTQASAVTRAPKLYLLTNDDEFAVLYAKLEAAFVTGLIALLQIRRKKTLQLPDGATKLYDEALQIVRLAKTYDVPVVINDDIKLAEKFGVGVHLGQQDAHHF
jgi:thiamine-phosphate pyrophosphorylase